MDGGKAAALIIFNIHKTKQVHYTNFQLNTKPILAMLNATHPFGQLVERCLRNPVLFAGSA
jgi:hypothetical protein